MAAAGATSEVLQAIEAEAPRMSTYRGMMKTAEGRIGAALALALLGLALIGPLFASPTQLGDAQPAMPPSSAHPLGTDALGRDVLDRLLAGGGTVLLIPLVAVTLSLLLGGGLGLFAAYRGGGFDVFLTKVFDLMLSLPPLLVVLVVISGFGSSNSVLIVTVAIVFAPSFGRVVRGATQSVVVNLYVAAAKARGERGIWIVSREIAPNIVAPLLAEYGLRLTYAILFVAGLSFLGLGVQPPAPDWGLMVAENRGLLAVTPLATLAPALAITGLALSFNLLADALTRTLTVDEASRVTVL